MAQSISDDTPNGRCRTCGFHLQNTKGKQKICVNCEIQGDQPTDETNEYGDPGHAATIQALGSVIPPKERTKPTQEIPADAKAFVGTAVQAPVKGVGIAKNVQTISEPLQALEQVKRYFAVIPVTDLRQAKELMKLRTEIDKLATKITNFIGG
jgi:hypothetical protein